MSDEFKKLIGILIKLNYPFQLINLEALGYYLFEGNENRAYWEVDDFPTHLEFVGRLNGITDDVKPKTLNEIVEYIKKIEKEIENE